MPSTYSPSLKLQLIGTGEQAGVWGTTTNYNLGTLLEQAITGVVTIPMGDATYTLTNYNGLSDEARNAVLVLNGPITAPQALIIPPQQKVYIVRNRTGNSVTLSANVGGVNVSIANAASEVLFCDGSNVYSATQFNYIDGDLTVSANVTVGNNITVAGNATFARNIFGNGSTDQWYVPVGNTAARTSSPIEGLIRYNTDGEFYEGYANSTWVRFLVANQGSYTITYAAVGGGGGGQNGGFTSAGGGGQFVTSTTPAIPGTTILTIVIGGGGPGGGGSASNGSQTSITGIAGAIGGGGGYSAGGGTDTSHGGASGNGYAGSQGLGSAGGGGAGGAATSNNGGPGASTLITGISQTFAGGGGGGSAGGGAAGQGLGVNGGGNGGWATIDTQVTPTAGSPNTGGGGGGSAYNVGMAGGNGGSGVVFLSMPTINYTGIHTGSPTVTTSGSNTILKFTGSGTYTC